MWKNYMTAHKRGMLKNRVQLLPKHGWFDFSLAPTVQCGTPLTKDGLLSMGAVKLFQDGSLQGYTGYLSNPYHSLPDAISDGSWRGYPIYNPRELVNIVTRYHEEGWQVAIHGNGDAGIEDILNAFEEAQKAVPPGQRAAHHHPLPDRPRGSARPHRTARRGSVLLHRTHLLLGRPPSGHLPRESPRIPDRSAAERPKRGIPFTSHNDTSVTPMDPLLSVWSAVNRLTGSGKVLGEDQTRLCAGCPEKRHHMGRLPVP